MSKLLKFLVFMIAGASVSAHAQLSGNDARTDSGEQVVPVVVDEPADVPDVAAQAQLSSGDATADSGEQDIPVVVDEPADVPGAAAEDNRSPAQRLADEFERYRQLVADGVLDEADTSAKRIVEMVIRLHGPESLETSKALNNLALVQSRNGQYDAAIQNFESAVAIIETVEDRLNEKLVNPLTGIGSAQLKNGRPDLAAEAFNRARHITHVNEGPHNIQQVEILEALAQATLLAGDAKGARELLDRMYALNVRHFAGDEMALIPALMRRANWQHAARYFNDERATYRRIIRIMENQLGKNDPQLILPLSKLGESFYFVDLSQSDAQQRSMVSTGEIYFKRAVRIAEATPDIDWREFARVKLALADHYIYSQSLNRAKSLYKEVWAFLSTDDERRAMRKEVLEQPAVLVYDSIPEYAFRDGDASTANENLLTGTIRVDYTVSSRGRVRNLRTEAIPAEFTDMQRMVHREIRRRVFRPQMVDAEIGESDSLVFEHKFYYRQSDLDKLIQANKKAAES